jgi:hypothetical protein
MLYLLSNQHTLIDEQNKSRDGGDQKPASIEQKIGVKERHLLSIVVCNQLEWLHRVLVVACDEANEEADSILLPTLINLFSSLIMQREMLQNDS